MAAPDLEVSIPAGKQSLARCVLTWANTNLRNYPWRNPDRTPYQVVIAEVLLKRTTATAAADLYEAFLHMYPSFRAIDNADEHELAHILSRVGLQRQRSIALKRMAHYLITTHGDEVPRDLSDLLAVPGLGEYSARAVLCFAYNLHFAVVDANVDRVLSRVFHDTLPPNRSARSVQMLADALLPAASTSRFNLAMLDLGALVCRYTRPRHEACPLSLICDSFARGPSPG